MPKPLKYRELRKVLNKYGVKEIKNRGKGSHRIFYHPNINGRAVVFPVKCHNEGQEIAGHIVKRVFEKFNIPDIFCNKVL